MVFGFLFGWNRKIRKLRKRWDRLREKTLKKKNPLKNELLKRLDDIENHLRLLEEQKLGRYERARFYRDVAVSLEEVKELLSADEEALHHLRRPHRE